jgi:hypothetical protein
MSIGTLKICCVCGTTYSQWAPRQKTCTRRCSKERAKEYDRKANRLKSLEKAKANEKALEIEMANRRHKAADKISMREKFSTSAEVVQSKLLDLRDEIELMFSEAQDLRATTDHLVRVGTYKYGPKKQS